MRKNPRLSLSLFAALMFILGGCAHQGGVVLYSPPSLLPHTTPEMWTAGFWISRHPAADPVILSSEDIIRFNQKIRQELQLTKDLSQWQASIPGEALRARMRKDFDDLKARGLTFLNGRDPSAAYWSSTEEAFNLDGIPAGIARRYGLVVSYADQRLLPMGKGLYVQAHDEDFDELQNSALDIGTPVAILHRSADGKWLFVESSSSSGWVKAENVAAATDDQVKPFWSTPFVVVTAPKGDIYFNRALTDFAGSLQMGARLPLMRFDGDYAEITVPQRQSDGNVALVPGFVAAEQVHEGYLPYTPRQILLQAFKMLHQPYGWGGMYGAQDCSRFLQEVFATVGIELPRDSRNQIQVGTRVAEWVTGAPGVDKLRALADSAIGGITILGMKGHILLYLGSVAGRPYAIHSVWAYRQAGVGKDDVFVLNRVLVSDLSLGEGSKRGSLLERLNAVRSLAR